MQPHHTRPFFAGSSPISTERNVNRIATMTLLQFQARRLSKLFTSFRRDALPYRVTCDIPQY